MQVAIFDEKIDLKKLFDKNSFVSLAKDHNITYNITNVSFNISNAMHETCELMGRKIREITKRALVNANMLIDVIRERMLTVVNKTSHIMTYK